MGTVRLPVTEIVEPRSATADKDSLSSNLFFEQDSKGNKYAVKRPGITSYISGSGQAQGIFIFNDQTFQFMSDPLQQYDIVWDGTNFVIAATYGTDFYAMLSTDGKSWTLVDTNQVTTSAAAVRQLAYNGTVLCATTANDTPARSFTSTDGGLTWSRSNMPSNHDYGVVSDGAGTFLAYRKLSSSNTVYTSSDGVTWTSRTLPGSITTQGAGFVRGVFVITSATTTTVYTSADGVSWNSGTGGLASPSRYFGRFADNGTVGVAVTDNSLGTDTIASSTDGATWTSRYTTGSSGGTRGILWDGTKFIVSNGGVVFITSTDGLTWTAERHAIFGYGPIRSASDGSGTSVFIDNSFARSNVLQTEDNLTSLNLYPAPAIQLYTATIT